MARVLLFTGDGKGKTTAALGTVLRALGHGMRALIFQFVKSDTSTGEHATLEQLPGADIVVSGRGFVPEARSPLFAAHRAAAEAGLDQLRAALQAGDHDIYVLDEVCIAVSKGLLAEAAVVEAVGAAPESAIVILTGRGASAALKAIADTVTEMHCLKHGYKAGIAAQEGVER